MDAGLKDAVLTLGNGEQVAGTELAAYAERATLASRLIDQLGRRLGNRDVVEQAAIADEIFSILMGEDVESRKNFIQSNAKDVRFLDI